MTSSVRKIASRSKNQSRRPRNEPIESGVPEGVPRKIGALAELVLRLSPVVATVFFASS